MVGGKGVTGGRGSAYSYMLKVLRVEGVTGEGWESPEVLGGGTGWEIILGTRLL